MRFFSFNNLLKLELAKYSLALSLQALLFVLIVRRLNYRMTLQSSLATYFQNKNANRLYAVVRDTRISCNSKKVIFAIENETYVNDSPITSCKIKLLLSLKTGVFILNPYLDERYLGKKFLISLFSETYRSSIDEKNNSKQIYLQPQESCQSYLQNSICLVDEFSKDERDGNRKWANWKKSELSISYQSNLQSDQPPELSELVIIAEKYFAKEQSVFVKTVASDDGFIKESPNITRNEILKADKTSRLEPILEPTLSSSEHDSICLKEDHGLYPSNCAVIEPQDSTTNAYNVPENVNLGFEKVKPNRISPNSQDNSDRSEFETFKFIKVPKLPMAEKISKNLEMDKRKSEKKFSKLILPIMQDGSNSDMQKSENEVNYHATIFRSYKKSDTRHHWEYNNVYSCDDSSAYTRRNQSCFTNYQFIIEKDKASDISGGHYSMTKRTRANSADSGVCLDSNFEEMPPESPAQESNSYENGSFQSCKTDVSREFVSGLNSSKPLYVDDCYKVCHLCKKIILKFFLSGRFGLLLNCFHSFCYSCIRNHSKSERFGTSWVKCPKCGKHSPGIVSSPRWIRDTYEKTILFQMYEMESKFFIQQQQVFFNLFSI